MWTAAAVVAVQAALSAIYAAGVARGSVPGRFDFDLEANVPTWWSSVLLLAIAVLCALLALARRAGGDAHVRWWLAAAGFAGLSLEEVAQIHEQVGVLVGGGRDRVSVWPLVYMPVLVVGAVVLVRCLRDLPRVPRLMVAVGLALYCVTVGAELTAIVGDLRGAKEVLVEEDAEAVGAALILVALTAAAAGLPHRVRAAFGGRLADDAGRRLLAWAALALAGVQIGLTVAFVAVRRAGDPTVAFDLGGEGNVAAWWASTLLLSVAAVCALLAATRGAATRRAWAVASAAFVLLSLQEVARVHEALRGIRDRPVAAVAIVVLACAAAAVALLAGVRCRADLPPPARRLALAGLAGYLVSVAVEATTAGRARRGTVEATLTENLQMASLGAVLLALAAGLAARVARSPHAGAVDEKGRASPRTRRPPEERVPLGG